MLILLKLFYEFFLIGLFTFGGGYAMIPLIKDVAINNGWLSEVAFVNFLAVCESTPGPIAINMATYIGATQYGFIGGVVATLGVVLPSFIIILLISICLKKFIKNKYFTSFVNGIKPVVIGLILSTGAMLIYNCIIKNVETNLTVDYISLIVFALICIIYYVYKAIRKKKMNNILLIVVSAVLSIVICLII
jgi:chromate transporter